MQTLDNTEYESIDLFGKVVKVRNKPCSVNGKIENSTSMKLDLYIKVSDSVSGLIP